MYLYGASAAILFEYRGASGAATGEAWLPLDALGLFAVLYGLTFLVLATLLLVGLGTGASAAIGSLLIAAALVVAVRVDPFHNTMNHLLPLFFALTIIALRSYEPDRWSGDSWLGWKTGRELEALTLSGARWMLGAIFLMQGWASLSAGPLYFARRIYVEPFRESILPEPLLFLAGVTNPFLQLITGLLLVLGLFTRQAALISAGFLVTILLGHVIRNPWDSGADVHAYAFANLLLALFIIWRAVAPDPLSLQRLLLLIRRRVETTAEMPQLSEETAWPESS